MQTTGAGLAVVGAERRLSIWLAIYAIALVAVVPVVIGSTALVLTVAFLIVVVILIIAGWHHAFGLANLIVLALFGAWLSTRPLWIGPLRRTLKVEATKQLAPYLATLYVGTDGVDIDLRPPTIGPAL